MTGVRNIRIQRATIGLRGMAGIVLQHRLGRHLRMLATCWPLFEEARGLEIGGPSAIFARDGILPLYPLLRSLDNCDFAGETIWHEDPPEGSPFRYDRDREPGRLFVRDATALDAFADRSYDVVLSSHTLEHVANPLRALDVSGERRRRSRVRAEVAAQPRGLPALSERRDRRSVAVRVGRHSVSLCDSMRRWDDLALDDLAR